MQENNQLFNPHYKLGIKILNNGQLKTVLPGFDLLKSQIQRIRDEISELDLDKCRFGEKQLNLFYDNTFSIIGERGTGKTSVLFTLKHLLAMENKDILLPVILPDMIGPDESIAGWLLATLEPVVAEIESKARKLYCKNQYWTGDKYTFYENCVFNKNHLLRREYDELRKAFQASRYEFQNPRYTYTELLKIMDDQSLNSSRFISLFSKFWDTLIGAYVKVNSAVETACENSNNQESRPQQKGNPLIFIFFDDADLVPHVINELLCIIPKYISHPNILLLVSASPNILELTTKYKLYKDIVPNRQGLFEMTDEANIAKRLANENSLIEKLTLDLLKKAFPLVNRFALKTFETLEAKAGMLFQSGPGAFEKVSEFFAREIRRLSPREPSGDYLVSVRENSHELKSRMLISFLGSTPREINNVCFALKNLIDSIEAVKKGFSVSRDVLAPGFYDPLYDVILTFFDVAVQSNHKLRCFTKKASRFLLRKYNRWGIYVNYIEINTMFFAPAYVENNKRDITPFLDFYSLLHFLEHIIYLSDPSREKTHGYDELNMLFSRLGSVEIVFKSRNMLHLLLQLEHYYDEEILNHFNPAIEAHQDIFLSTVDKMKLFQFSWTEVAVKKNLSALKEDPYRINILCEILYRKFSGVNVIQRLSSDDYTLAMTRLYNDEYSKQTNFDMMENLFTLLTATIDYTNLDTAEQVLQKEYSKHYGKAEEGQSDVIKSTADRLLEVYGAKDKEGRTLEILTLKKVYEFIKPSLGKLVPSLLTLPANKPKETVADIFERLKTNVYKYTLLEKAVLIADKEKLSPILEDLRDYTNEIDATLRNFTNDLNKRGRIAIERFENYYGQIKRLFSRLEDLRSNESLGLTLSGDYREALNNLPECFSPEVKADQGRIIQAMEYLLSLEAIKPVHQSYLIARIREEEGFDSYPNAFNEGMKEICQWYRHIKPKSGAERSFYGEQLRLKLQRAFEIQQNKAYENILSLGVLSGRPSPDSL